MMIVRPEKCSKCIFSDCMLTNAQALICEIEASFGEDSPPLLEKSLRRISQTSIECPNAVGSVEVWDNSLGVSYGMTRVGKCGKWDCPVCGTEKAKKIRKRLIKALHFKFDEVQAKGISDSWKFLKFLTLTCYHDKVFKSQKEAYEAMASGWNKLLTAMKRSYGKIEVFKVVECHKDGYPHFHIILWAKEYIPFQWIQEKWIKYGVGRFVNISNKTRKFQSVSHVANYITKYLMKSVGATVSWFKRWSQSRGFLLALENIKWWTGYEFHKNECVEWLCWDKQKAGYWTEWQKDKRGFYYYKN